MTINKYRISKKNLSELPAAVAEKIAALGTDYNIASFTFHSQPEGYRYVVGEGERVEVVYSNRSAGFETVSENTMGATGLFGGIGAEIKAPAGTFIIVVWYYCKYGMTVYNIGQAALTQ